jgi:hypothetical protein
LPIFFRAVSRARNSFGLASAKTFLISAACLRKIGAINSLPFGVSDTIRTRRSSGLSTRLTRPLSTRRSTAVLIEPGGPLPSIRAVKRAVAFLLAHQTDSGGFLDSRYAYWDTPRIQGTFQTSFVEEDGATAMKVALQPDSDDRKLLATLREGDKPATMLAENTAQARRASTDTTSSSVAEAHALLNSLGITATVSPYRHQPSYKIAVTAAVAFNEVVFAGDLSISRERSLFARQEAATIWTEARESTAVRYAGPVYNLEVDNFPNGCHVCEVEIDPETGKVNVVAYCAVDDVGTVINPLIVHGQVHGGVAQGIGQVLLERIAYDDDGQLITGSLMDYGLPRAANLPTLSVDFHPTPSTKNPIGVKGSGEVGVTGSIPAVLNAVNDALARVGASAEISMPVTSEKVWRYLREAKLPKVKRRRAPAAKRANAPVLF